MKRPNRLRYVREKEKEMRRIEEENTVAGVGGIPDMHFESIEAHEHMAQAQRVLGDSYNSAGSYRKAREQYAEAAREYSAIGETDKAVMMYRKAGMKEKAYSLLRTRESRIARMKRALFGGRNIAATLAVVFFMLSFLVIFPSITGFTISNTWGNSYLFSEFLLLLLGIISFIIAFYLGKKK